MEEKPEMFPCSAFRFLVFDEYQSALIPRKLLCLDKNLVTHLYLNDLSANCSRKESVHRFFGRALYENHENAKCPDFQFHNVKFSQERYFGPFMLLQPLAYIWKNIYERALLGNFGSNESINFNYQCNKLVNYRSFLFYCTVIFTGLCTI